MPNRCHARFSNAALRTLSAAIAALFSSSTPAAATPAAGQVATPNLARATADVQTTASAVEAGVAAVDPDADLAALATDDTNRMHEHVVGRMRPDLSADTRTLRLELFSGPPLQFERKRLLGSENGHTWIGTLPGDDDSRIYVTHLKGVSVGEAFVDGAYYRILGVGPEWTITEVEEADGDCAVGEVQEDSSQPDSGRLQLRGDADVLKPARVDDAMVDSHPPVELDPKTFSDAALARIFQRFFTIKIDVMVVYTPNVRHRAWSSLSPNDKAHFNAYGYGQVGGAQVVVEAWAQNSIDQTNDIFADSGIIARLRLAHAQEVERPENQTYIDDYLDWMYLVANNPGNQVYDLRETHEADLVQLWVSDSGVSKGLNGPACGIARMLDGSAYNPNIGAGSGVSVLDLDCRLGLTFAHELAHNLGAAHDRYQVDTYDKIYGWFDYSHGYVHEASHPSLPSRRTVMAYRSYCKDNGFECPRIPHFSNPSIDLLGIKTGSAGVADNARTINLTGWYVSQHKPTPSSPVPLPTP